MSTIGWIVDLVGIEQAGGSFLDQCTHALDPKRISDFGGRGIARSRPLDMLIFQDYNVVLKN